MSLQLIKRKPITIRVENKEFQFVKPYYLSDNNKLKLIRPVVKGSCLVWHILGKQITYYQIKKLL